MGRNVVDQHDAFRLRRTFGIFDDFHNYTSGGVWTTVAGGSATIAAGDNAGGILTLSCIDSTDNRECFLKGTNETLLFAAGKPIIAEALIQYTEANTNTANVFFGFMNAVGAASMQDNGAGPKASFSGAGIFKVDGGTQWKTISSLSTTQTISQSDTTAGGSSYQRLRVEATPVSSTILEVTYWVDGVQLKVSGSRTPIKDQVTYTGATEMQLALMLKNGSTSAEVLLCDYIAVEQTARLFT